MFEESSNFSTPPSSPPISSRSYSPGLGSPASGGVSSPGVPGVDQSKASSVSWCTNFLSVKGSAKPHNFKVEHYVF